MTRTRRPSPQTVAVLTALAADPAVARYGYELGQEVGLKAGSLYPILIRLCERGLLVASWEADPPSGRPPRHLYRLTATGVREARAARGASVAQGNEVARGNDAKGSAARPATGRGAVATAARLRSAW